MPKLLLISYRFPPFNSAESICSGRTASALMKMGWDITVLTVSLTSCPDKIDTDLLTPVKDSKIIRISSFERVLLAIKNSALSRIIYRSTEKIMKFMGIPEINMVWFPNALREGKLILQENDFDLIYSRSFVVSNIVGLYLKRFSGLPWIVYFSDPWVDNPYARFNKLEKIFCKYYERIIIKEANEITFVTQRIANLVMSKYPKDIYKKVHIIPHGFVEEQHYQNTNYQFLNSRFQMVYTGDFYGKRSPEKIFSALKMINNIPAYKNKIEFLIISRNVDQIRQRAFELGIDEIVKFQQNLSHKTTQQIASSADVLVLIDAASLEPNIFLPSKLIDYLSLKKPILGITPIEGETNDLLQQAGFHVVDPNNVLGIAEGIISLYNDWESDHNIISPNFEAIISKYHILETTKLLDNVCRKYVN